MSGFLLLAAAAIAPQDAGGSSGSRLVKLDLLADRAAIRPGETFSLGVRFKIEPKWHIYWENHGDSGFPTRASVTGPAGFEIGPLRHPGPERHVEEGDIVTYVHHGEVVLLVDVRAPEAFPPGLSKAAFEVEARWLVCSEVCLPGSGETRIEIPVATGAAPAPANDVLFAAARARLPRPWTELRSSTVEWSGDEGSPTLTVMVPGARDLEIFPLASETMALESREVDAGGRLTAQLRFRPQSPGDAPRLQAVLRVRHEKAESFFQLDTARKQP